MEPNIQTYSGYALIGNDKCLYRYEDNEIAIYTGADFTEEPQEYNRVIAYGAEKYVGQATLYQMSSPICIGLANSKTLGSVRYRVGNYVNDGKYTSMSFQFPELEYFYPSVSLKDRIKDGNLIKQDVNEICIRYHGDDLYVAFTCGITSSITNAYGLQTHSSLRVRFDETGDIEYLLGIYRSIRAFFCFVCNRQNIGLRCVTLRGTSDTQAISFHSILIPNDQYLDDCETKEQIKETLEYSVIEDHFSELLQLFFSNEVGDRPIVTSYNLHASVKARSLIDLNLSLHITSTFEYLYRTLTPDKSSAKNEMFHMKIKEQKPTLSDKIEMIYNGYDIWQPVMPILYQWYGRDISFLAKATSKWRNELAHEKRSYKPDINTVHGIRLVECLNYCIILRHAGYDDDNIKAIIFKILDVVDVN